MRLFTALLNTHYVSKKIIGRTNPRKLVLLVLMLLAFATGHHLVSARSDFYLFVKYCLVGSQAGERCEDAYFNGYASVYAEGNCISDRSFIGPSLALSSFAYGTCAGWTVRNYAEVSGEYHDPGLDGSWKNTIDQTGLTVTSGGGANHCDGWRDQWQIDDLPCPRPPGGEVGCYEGSWGYTHTRQECEGTYFDCNCDIETPVIIDVSGDGFALTSAADGVDFDINADNILRRVSWMAAGSDDAWLALDRNGNGLIDNAAELFGDVTPQPLSGEPNGFRALAEFDRPPNGGNGDGVIDERDAITSALRLWQDANHNGLSEQGELHSLPSLQIKSISIAYREVRRRDAHGNQFRYQAQVTGTDRRITRRLAYDVFLLRGS